MSCKWILARPLMVQAILTLMWLALPYKGKRGAVGLEGGTAANVRVGIKGGMWDG